MGEVGTGRLHSDRKRQQAQLIKSERKVQRLCLSCFQLHALKSFQLHNRAYHGFDELRLLDASYHWVVEPGDFTVLAGANAGDLPLRADFRVV